MRTEATSVRTEAARVLTEATSVCTEAAAARRNPLLPSLATVLSLQSWPEFDLESSGQMFGLWMSLFTLDHSTVRAPQRSAFLGRSTPAPQIFFEF